MGNGHMGPSDPIFGGWGLGGRLGGGVLRSHVLLQRGWALYSEAQCIMGNGHMGPPLWTDRQVLKHYLPVKSKWLTGKLN